MCLVILLSSSPSASILLKMLLTPESIKLLLNDSMEDVTDAMGRAFTPGGVAGETPAVSCCVFKTE